MIVGIKDTVKLIGITIVACCAVFVCTLFLSYNADLAEIENDITAQTGQLIFQAQKATGTVTVATTGGCLGVTSLILLLFYIKNYIDIHGKQLGILKALGYPNKKIAGHFSVFGLPVFLGCLSGFLAAFLYLPTFYHIQNKENLLPEIPIGFHPLLCLLLVGAPTLLFMLLSVLYANHQLKKPVITLLKEKKETRRTLKNRNNIPFLKNLRKMTLRTKKSLPFFMAFSAFCFSAMTQMAFSMKQLASEDMAVMMIGIGLILAFTTLLLSLSTVIKGNAETLAMMRALGYPDRAGEKSVLGSYRPIAAIGFALGTGYQYCLLKLVITILYTEFDAVQNYHFSFPAFAVSLVIFLLFYEISMIIYKRKMKKLSLKTVMTE